MNNRHSIATRSSSRMSRSQLHRAKTGEAVARTSTTRRTWCRRCSAQICRCRKPASSDSTASHAGSIQVRISRSAAYFLRKSLLLVSILHRRGRANLPSRTSELPRFKERQELPTISSQISLVCSLARTILYLN